MCIRDRLLYCLSVGWVAFISWHSRSFGMFPFCSYWPLRFSPMIKLPSFYLSPWSWRLKVSITVFISTAILKLECYCSLCSIHGFVSSNERRCLSFCWIKVGPRHERSFSSFMPILWFLNDSTHSVFAFVAFNSTANHSERALVYSSLLILRFRNSIAIVAAHL